ncbi:hypothetical protein D3OALGB2SA_3159 [Olavius algarvensis associated proteobacterium Delta 3]|nr:hypothetical protein D3OALGB2SA_3159 [Olavius algarvensis associated proteobacterium Delta 3]
MNLRILTWNMNHWQKKSMHEKIWKYLDKELAPDIALIQETVPFSKSFGFIGMGSEYPTSLLETQTVLWREIGGNRKWGSGIVTRGLPIREIPIKTTYYGSLIVGEIMLPDKSLLTVISLHALLEQGYSITTLHRMFSDLTFLLDGKLGKRKVILGGDFNASIQWDKQQPGESHRIMFERLENFGLLSCVDLFSEKKSLQTYRHNRGNTPWQLDYLFISDTLRKYVTSCTVSLDETLHEFSDHNPIILELSI